MTFTLPAITPEEESELMGGAQFKHLIIWRAKYWTLYLNENQAHLGRAYVWLHRHIDFMRFEELLPHELEEFMEILRYYRTGLDELWQPTLVNVAWLGNEYEVQRGHGHAHLIPRYARLPRMFECDGHKLPFADECFGKNYTHAAKRVLKPEHLEHIRSELERRIVTREMDTIRL